MNRTMLKILAASAVIFYGCDSRDPGAKSEAGKTAPGFRLVNYDGKIINLSDYKGKIVYSGAIDNSPLGKKKEGFINYVDSALAELATGESIRISDTEPYGCSVKYAN